MDDIIAISIDKVYRSEEVLQKEIVGYKVISPSYRHFVLLQ